MVRFCSEQSTCSWMGHRGTEQNSMAEVLRKEVRKVPEYNRQGPGERRLLDPSQKVQIRGKGQRRMCWIPFLVAIDNELMTNRRVNFFVPNRMLRLLRYSHTE